ncbi:MAG: GPW/gp25 family protein [Bacteroidetes bacterium]|nr:GPW/gp25 family protein [Bacteroidota bacterium]
MSTPVKNIRYPFAVDSGLGTLAVERDFAKHVRQMILQVLFTNPGERVNRPDFGCGIKRMVFAPNDDVTASLAQVTILQALNTWLGSLITVQDIKVNADNEKLEINISYSINAMSGRQYLNVEVTL